MAGLDYDNLDQQVEARAEQLRNEAAKTKLNESVQSAGFGAGGPTGDIAGMLSRAPSAGDFALRLPKNVGAGLLKAAYHTVEAADDAIGAVAGADQAGNIAGGPPASFFVEQAGGSDEAVKVATPVQTPPLQTVFPEAFEAIDGFFSSLDENMTVPDGIVQGIAQFAIPFTGYLKALSGMKNVSRLASVGRLALAEGVAAGTAFDAHDGRLSDLVQIGRQAENEFGAVLRKLSPDDSALTAFVNWLSDRENEGVWGGRFKNAVDSLAGTAVTLGVIKAVPEALRLGRQVLEDAGKASGTIRSQTGHVSFHGSPRQIDEFSLDAVGTGTGNQAFGWGINLAENPSVAGRYKGPAGSLSEVDIPDEAIAKMLRRDTAMAEQPEAVQKAVADLQKEYGSEMVSVLDDQGRFQRVSFAEASVGSGEQFYRALSNLTGSDEAASRLLAKNGVPGLSYPDALSRGKAEGTRNLVVFDDKLPKIVKRTDAGSQ